ncbi:YHS domain-containing protein [Candidatus Gottesmanbacteria bacterium]|nr:YHS domain-containing protein [Candidatus Gottesmanbacteria bacterium]
MFEALKKLFSLQGEEKDPVCGMTIDLATTQYKTTRDGKESGFCSAACKETFDKEPVKNTEGGS